MAKKDYALELVESYQKTFRHPELEKFTISGLYDLYPDNGTTQVIENSWPATWLNLSKAGVYLFLDENLEVVYIGKSNHFGSRLSSYFMYDEYRKCKAKHTWKTGPRFVITIAVPDSSRFECTSLEEFLLSKIVTSDNRLFNDRDETSPFDVN